MSMTNFIQIGTLFDAGAFYGVADALHGRERSIQTRCGQWSEPVIAITRMEPEITTAFFDL